jgi:hypothetical protein
MQESILSDNVILEYTPENRIEAHQECRKHAKARNSTPDRHTYRHREERPISPKERSKDKKIPRGRP